MKKFEYKHSTYNKSSAEIIAPFVVNLFKPTSVVDFGCGKGDWLSVFHNLGVLDLCGVDFNTINQSEFAVEDAHLIKHDLGSPISINRKFDIALSLETAEHIAPEAANTFIENLCSHSDTIVFSAAIPGQGGKGHINEQWPNYWIKLFDRFGFKCYDILREQFWDNESIHSWYRQNILIFSKRTIDYQPVVALTNIVHPSLLEIKNKDINNILAGKMGIRVASRAFFKAVINLLSFQYRD